VKSSSTAPEVEGVHLRFGAVARGGLRWSDRAQDYRTEVLGLVKAQQVKNAVIVPVGAKGGFYPRLLPTGGSRAEIFEAGKKRLHQLHLDDAVDHRQSPRRQGRAAEGRDPS
jgi:NAD-specific glutamate dehydrogenase